MKRSSLILALSAGALAIALPAASSAAPMVPGEGRMIQGLVEHFLNDPQVRQQANITDEQADQIETIVFQTRRSVVEQQGQAAVARLDLEQLWRADAPDAQAIHAAIDHIGQIQTQTRQALADARLQIQAILAPEQRETLQTLGRERMREHTAERGEGRGRPGERIRDRVRERFGRPGPGGEDQGQGPGGPQGGPEGQGPQAGFGPPPADGPQAFGEPGGDDFLAMGGDPGLFGDEFLFAPEPPAGETAPQASEAPAPPPAQ
jgi:Spy/CpxP family protein refolding chaperone